MPQLSEEQELQVSLYNHRHKLKELYLSETGSLLVRFLSNKLENKINDLLYNNQQTIDQVRGLQNEIVLLKSILDLPEDLSRWKLVETEQGPKAHLRTGTEVD
jgi:hypothetical protein